MTPNCHGIKPDCGLFSAYFIAVQYRLVLEMWSLSLIRCTFLDVCCQEVVWLIYQVLLA